METIEIPGGVTVLQGDNMDTLPNILCQSVHCVVTSPPYFGLRSYQIPPTQWPEIEYSPMAGLPPITIPAMECCLGAEKSPLEFVGHLVAVYRQVWRVLRDDGTCWLNLGDSYAAQGGAQVPQTRSTDNKAASASQTLARRGVLSQGFKPKDLIMIPARAAMALQADGWTLRSDIIWSKPNPMPESVTDRPTKAHEYIFLLSKKARYYYDAEAIKEMCVDGDPRAPLGSVAVLGKLNNSRRKQDEVGKRTYTGFNDRWDKRPARLEKRNKRSVWDVPTSPTPEAHFATFPTNLIEPCILAGCPANGVVLDIYGGSGTTAMAARNLGRRAILCEANPDYIGIMKKRLNAGQLSIMDVAA